MNKAHKPKKKTKCTRDEISYMIGCEIRTCTESERKTHTHTHIKYFFFFQNYDAEFQQVWYFNYISIHRYVCVYFRWFRNIFVVYLKNREIFASHQHIFPPFMRCANITFILAAAQNLIEFHRSAILCDDDGGNGSSNYIQNQHSIILNFNHQTHFAYIYLSLASLSLFF